MVYKPKNNWKPYGMKGEIVEIIIRDDRGQKIGNFKCITNKDYNKVLNLVEDKFGYYRENSNEIKEEKQEEINKEKNWLEKDWEW